jgi:hypothetical protein
MPLRGPYKQYDMDASIEVPRSTLHDRRKRRFVEVDHDRDEVEDRAEELDGPYGLQQQVSE